MKFHLSRPDGRNQFSGYGPGYVAVNGTRYESSIIVLPDRIEPWEPEAPDQWTGETFAQLAALPVEILLLGTGAALHFPHPRLTQSLREARLSLEVMDTQAACRTYNILLSEDRRVGAALLIFPPA